MRDCPVSAERKDRLTRLSRRRRAEGRHLRQPDRSGLGGLPPADAISFSARFRVSTVVADGLLGGLTKIMPVKPLNTERETVLNTGVHCHRVYTSLWRRGCLELPRVAAGVGG